VFADQTRAEAIWSREDDRVAPLPAPALFLAAIAKEPPLFLNREYLGKACLSPEQIEQW
jgi:hypothetical protein